MEAAKAALAACKTIDVALTGAGRQGCAGCCCLRLAGGGQWAGQSQPLVGAGGWAWGQPGGEMQWLWSGWPKPG